MILVPLSPLSTRKDQYHTACKQVGDKLPEVLTTCWPVITEACYLLRRRPDYVQQLLEMVHAGYYEILNISVDDITEVGGLLDKYRDQQIDLADACLVHLADREGISTVFTVDERHFQLFRTDKGKPFQLLSLRWV